MKIIKLSKKESEKIAENIGKSLGKKEQKKFDKIKKIVIPDKFIIKGDKIQFIVKKCPKCGYKHTFVGYFICPECDYDEYEEEQKRRNAKRKKLDTKALVS